MHSGKLTAIGFDLDHTLCRYALSTAEVIHEALRRSDCPADLAGDPDAAAAEYDRRWLENERAAASLAELRTMIWRGILSDRGCGDDDLAARIATAYDTVRRESGVLLHDGVRELLANLRSHYRLGLLTNGPSEMQREKIRSLGLESSFDAIIIAGEIGIYKPDPGAFSALLDRLESPAEQTLFVGDSYEADVEGARGAGLLVVWITDDGSSAGTIADPAGLVRLARVAELPEIL